MEAKSLLLCLLLYETINLCDKCAPPISAKKSLNSQNYIHKKYSDNIELVSMVEITPAYHVMPGILSMIFNFGGSLLYVQLNVSLIFCLFPIPI